MVDVGGQGGRGVLKEHITLDSPLGSAGSPLRDVEDFSDVLEAVSLTKPSRDKHYASLCVTLYNH